MLPIRTILYPTDFSQHSGYAFPLACALARDYGARLVALHVVSAPVYVYGEGYLPPAPDELIVEAQEQLHRLLPVPANVRVEQRVAQGDTAPEILGVAHEIEADLIVMGTHGRTGLTRLLMGSVAEQVMRKAECPVLTIRSPLGSAPESALLAEELVSTADGV